MTPLWCALSIDLDEIGHYRRLHGLPLVDQAAGAVYDVALDRIAEFALRHRIPVTLFAVGEDLGRSAAADGLAGLATAGHTVENHSQRHRFDLSRLSRTEARAEVMEAHRAIQECTGRAPVGFRAPGYTLSDRLLDVLDGAGYLFDSSVFPCPAYYAAKALAMARLRVRGRTTAAVLDTPRVWRAPRVPYRPGRPWYRAGGRGLLELPILVTPRLRLPVIGTSLVWAGKGTACAAIRRCTGMDFVGLELHGIDFLSAADGLDDLVPAQWDLRLPLSRKLAVLDGVVAELRAAGGRFVSLAEAAAALGEVGETDRSALG